MLFDPKWEIEAPADIQLAPWQKVLLKAADIIERDGWHQGGHFWRKRSCAIGAINRAAGKTVTGNTISGSSWEGYGEAVYYMTEYVRSKGIPNIPDWNDAYGRTKEEVIAGLRACAKMENSNAV